MPATAAGVFTTNLAQAAPVQVSRRHLANGRASAVVLSSGNANAATGEPGRRDAARMCELAGAGPRPRGRRRARVLDRSHRDPDADGRARGRHPEALRRARGRRRRPRGAGDDDHRHDGEGSGRARARRPSAGWRRARRCCRPPWPRCSRWSPPMPRPTTKRCNGPSRAVSETFDCLSVDGCRSTNDTVLVLANGAPARSTRTRSPTRSPRCAARSPNRWRATPKARRSSSGSGSSAPGPRPRRGSPPAPSPNSQLVQCSLNGNDPYWGRVLSELGASGAHLDPEAVDISYNGITVCRDGVACAHDERDHRCPRRARHRDPLRPA